MTSLAEATRSRAADLAACHLATSERPLTCDETLRLGLACGRQATLEVLAEQGMLVWRGEG